MGLTKPTIEQVPVAKLIPASWNYKTEGSDEQIEKLASSIREDQSAGVMAVRVLKSGKRNGDGKLEVIDGNHRLKAVQSLGWKTVWVENFGVISDGDAVLVARRRNFQWFEDNVLKYAELFRDKVLTERSIDELVAFMPESKGEMESIAKLLEFDWSQFHRSTGGEPPLLKTIKLEVPTEVFEQWMSWLERAKEMLGYDNPAKAFEFAIVEVMNVPVESFGAHKS
jgi:hypothetical protein